MGRREVFKPEMEVWLAPGTDLKERSFFNNPKLELQDLSSRKPPGSALACLWDLITSPSLSLSQRVQWPMSLTTPLVMGTRPPLHFPWPPSKARLPPRPTPRVSLGTVWLRVQTQPEQSGTGLARVLVCTQLSLSHDGPPHAAAQGF